MALDKDDANSFTNKGFRAVALGKINDQLTIQVTALHESARSDSAWTATGDVKDLKNDFHQLLEPQEDEATLVSAQIDYATAFGTLTSITGYYTRSLDSLGLDATAAGATFLPVSKVWLIDHKSLSEELRFVSDLDGPWGFLVGAYYKDSKQHADLVDRLDTLALTGTVADEVERYEGEQISLFGELSYKLTDELTLTGGLRYFKEDVDSRQLWNSPELLFSFVPTNEFSTKISIEKVLPKVLLEYKATDSTLFYAGASEGARNGGLNVTSTINFIAFTGVDTAPFRSYRKDSARSYEIGTKTSWLDGQLLANAAIYYTQWRDMQLQVTTPPLPVFSGGLGYVGNASGNAARSKGAEVEMEYRPSESFRFFLGGTLANAELTKDVDINPTLETIAPKGSPIPGVSDWSFSAGGEISHPVAGGFARAVGRVNYQRRAKAKSFITTTAPTGATTNFTTPEFGLLNLGIGLEADTWRVDVFANNVTNEIVGLYEGFSESGFYINQPRTIGITLEKSF